MAESYLSLFFCRKLVYIMLYISKWHFDSSSFLFLCSWRYVVCVSGKCSTSVNYIGVIGDDFSCQNAIKNTFGSFFSMWKLFYVASESDFLQTNTISAWWFVFLVNLEQHLIDSFCCLHICLLNKYCLFHCIYVYMIIRETRFPRVDLLEMLPLVLCGACWSFTVCSCWIIKTAQG